MNTILLQVKLNPKEVHLLFNEFPNFLYLSFPGASYKDLTPEQWASIEIIYGDRLTLEELHKASQLKWIHTPSPHLNRLCLKEIVEQGNILITTTKEENLSQIGEYIMGAILAFAKNLFQWLKADQDPRFIWDSKWRDTMWQLEGKQFLQIGLGQVGTEIARRAKGMGMNVTGVEIKKTFHPYCQKTFDLRDLHQLLPQADVVSLALPLSSDYQNLMSAKELELMKEDSILTLVGRGNTVNDAALAAVSHKFRGVVIDAFYQIPIPLQSPLWKIDNILITPEVSPRPKSEEKKSFQLFRYNLRQYLYSNFSEMRNVIAETINLVT